MKNKTNFSFEVQLAADAPAQDKLPADLAGALERLLDGDGAAAVTVSDSHKGDNHKLVEIVSSLPDEALQKLLKSFAAEHRLAIAALE